jgi:crotonobetainyl-CoA:carnitine CoA-transferase CaiB-like acyl-CoA transferase
MRGCTPGISSVARISNGPPRRTPGPDLCQPPQLRETKITFRRQAPRVGEDGVEVLRKAGLRYEQIEALKASGALVLP